VVEQLTRDTAGLPDTGGGVPGAAYLGAQLMSGAAVIG